MREGAILYDGAVHIATASTEDKIAIERDIANICTEATLSVVEGVEFEVCALVAAAQAGEKIAHHGDVSMNMEDWRRVGVETVESVLSSPAAAMHASVDLVRDLERTGRTYRAKVAEHKPL